MYEILWKLSSHLRGKSNRYRSHFYRYKHLLTKKCGTLQGVWFLSRPEEIKLAEILSNHAPLLPEDVISGEQKRLLLQWNRIFPGDKKFFKTALQQERLWKKYKNYSIEQFLQSEDAEDWMRKRNRISRKPLYELDMLYKTTKKSATSHEAKIRNLMRENPFLRWEDLRRLGVKNSQSIYRNFPQRKLHLDLALMDLSLKLKHAPE